MPYSEQIAIESAKSARLAYRTLIFVSAAALLLGVSIDNSSDLRAAHANLLALRGSVEWHLNANRTERLSAVGFSIEEMIDESVDELSRVGPKTQLTDNRWFGWVPTSGERRDRKILTVFQIPFDVNVEKISVQEVAEGKFRGDDLVEAGLLDPGKLRQDARSQVVDNILVADVERLLGSVVQFDWSEPAFLSEVYQEHFDDLRIREVRNSNPRPGVYWRIENKDFDIYFVENSLQRFFTERDISRIDSRFGMRNINVEEYLRDGSGLAFDRMAFISDASAFAWDGRWTLAELIDRLRQERRSVPTNIQFGGLLLPGELLLLAAPVLLAGSALFLGQHAWMFFRYHSKSVSGFPWLVCMSGPVAMLIQVSTLSLPGSACFVLIVQLGSSERWFATLIAGVCLILCSGSCVWVLAARSPRNLARARWVIRRIQSLVA